MGFPKYLFINFPNEKFLSNKVLEVCVIQGSADCHKLVRFGKKNGAFKV